MSSSDFSFISLESMNTRTENSYIRILKNLVLKSTIEIDVKLVQQQVSH